MYSSKNKWLAPGLLLCLFFSCERKKVESVKPFFNFDSLIIGQIHFLSEMKPILKKEAIINGKEEKVSINLSDTTAWKRELDMFLQLNLLNKPVNRNSYKVEVENSPDSHIETYIATEDLPLAYLKLYFDEQRQTLQKIEASFDEHNALFSSSRVVSMEFGERFKKPVLLAYRLEGGQKMFLSDSVHFRMQASLLYSN